MKLSAAATNVAVEVMSDSGEIIYSYEVSNYNTTLDITELVKDCGGLYGLIKGIENAVNGKQPEDRLADFRREFAEEKAKQVAEALKVYQ